MKDNIQPCEVIESNLLDPTKETDLKTEFAQPIKEYQTGGTVYLGISPIQQAFNEMQRQQYRKNGKSETITQIIKP